MRRLSVLLLCLLAAPLAHAQEWSLPELMQALAQTRAGTARFTERQTSPLLSAPFISAGTLSFTAPDNLRKTTITPAPESFILDHNQITLTAAGATHVFQIGQDPRIAGMVEAIRGTLTGNLPRLQQFYTITLTGSATGWQLHLLPKSAALTRFLRNVTISGTQGHVTEIDTASADGSDSRMSITPEDAP